MRTYFRWLFLFFLLAFSGISPVTAQSPIAISSPGGGEALKGIVSISGTTQTDGFQAAEVSFAYANNPLDTWFILQESTEAVSDGTLMLWDTTNITDGVYDLRLRVFLQGGKEETVLVRGVRIRNYLPVETDTPAPLPTSDAASTPLPTAAPSMTPAPTAVPPTATPFPPNPLSISSNQIGKSLVQGALIAAAVFILLVLYTKIHAWINPSGG